MTDEILNCFRVLELKPGATLEEVNQARRELAKIWHPDRFPDDTKLQRKAQERLKEINLACEQLQMYLSECGPNRMQDTFRATGGPDGRFRTRDDSREGSTTASASPPNPPPKNQQTTRWRQAKRSAALKWVLVAVIILEAVILFKVRNESPESELASRAAGQLPTGEQTVPISKALDEKNGFKEFKFGMTPEEARRVLSPTEVEDKPHVDQRTFIYKDSTANFIGDYPTDILALTFFQNQLVRIDIQFSRLASEIVELFRINYGEPSSFDWQRSGWKRGDQPLEVMTWQGEKVRASMLGLPYKSWDTVTIYDIESARRARDYLIRKDLAPAPR